MCGTCSCRFRERVGVFFFYWISPAVKPAPRCHRRRRPAVSGTLPFLFFLTNHVFSAGSAYRQVPSRCSFPPTALLRILPLIVSGHHLPVCNCALPAVMSACILYSPIRTHTVGSADTPGAAMSCLSMLHMTGATELPISLSTHK